MKPHCPEWVHNAVFYEIYPQTFYDTNGDGIGDLPGIIEKLDYVASLGVGAIWLNPFYVSPMRDAGYDVADYRRVDPRYGTNADAKRLFREAHKRNLRVIIDFVPGHTSIDHPWFKESCKPQTNEYSNWYVWTKSSWDFAGSENAGKMIHGFCDRDGNYMINFFWSQPALNFGFGKPKYDWQLPTTHPDVQRLWKEMQDVLWFWLDMGCDGFRVDMAGSLIRNDPGNKEITRFWQQVRERLDRDYPEAFMISEWSAGAPALKAGFHADFYHWQKPYYSLWWKEGLPPRTEDKGQSFFSAQGKGDITEFLDPYTTLLKQTKTLGYISVPVGNHDLPRVSYKRTPADLECIYAFHLCMPGVPFIYYGDEIGMDHLLDQPVKEGCYPPRNGSRTPMQWSNERNAGFSQGKTENLYLPVDKSKKAPSVAAQENKKGSLLNRMRTLVQLRSREPALAAYGAFTALYAKKNAYPLVFLRSNGREKLLCVFNPAAREETVSVPIDFQVRSGELLAGTGVVLGTTGKGELSIQAGPRGYGVFRV